jgi:hypothetical protein
MAFSMNINKRVIIPLMIGLLLAGPICYLYFTNKQVAAEIRQIRQPRPNLFYVGIDVSATISTDIIEKLKDALIERLKNFVGDEAVAYHVTTFGNPGCAQRSFSEIVSTHSPADAVTFSWKVEEKIKEISIAKVTVRDTAPLTTPLYCFLETVLTEEIGGRIIIFSDLMNDDSDCAEQFLFPEEIITTFGADPRGQIIFLYPTPHLTENQELNQRSIKKQQEFINRMNELSRQGKVRVFFFHIPDDPLERMSFLRSQFQKAIPTTTFDVVWERTTRVFQTLVSAVRG